MKTLGIIGFGNLGSAVARGLVGKDLRLIVLEKKQVAANSAREKFGLEVYPQAEDFNKAADVLLLAVKPQELAALFSELGALTGGKQVISVVAGCSIKTLSAQLGSGQICRLMPNLAAAYGCAFTAVAFSTACTAEFTTLALLIARALGTVCEVPESLMSAMTGLSGSGIAFVFHFLQAMALGGVSAGIPYPQALEGAMAVASGAIHVLQESAEIPPVWLSRVISPSGTTIAGLQALEDGNMTAAVMRAVKAAAERAGELES